MARQEKRGNGKSLLLLLLLLGGAGVALALSNKTSSKSKSLKCDVKVTGNVITFDAESTAYQNPTYFWDFGDKVGTSNQKEGNYTYSKDGQYTVSVSVTEGGDESTLESCADQIIVKTGVPVGSHTECQNGKCATVLGIGDNKCVDDTTCTSQPPPTTHKICQGGSCVDFPGVGQDECTDNASCNNPQDPCICLTMTLTQTDNVAVGAKTDVKMLITNNCQNTIQGKLVLKDKSSPAQFSPITSSKDISISALANSMPFTPNQLTRIKSGIATLSIELQLVDGTVCKELTFVNGTAQGSSCAGKCGGVFADCSCADTCVVQGNCCSDKKTFCDPKTTFPRVLIVACASSPDELSEAQQMKNNMIGGSNEGWKDGINIFTAFISTLSSYSQIINDTNPEVIIIVGPQSSWDNCNFNVWKDQGFNSVNAPFDYLDMVQIMNEGNVGFIGLGGYIFKQTRQILNAFTSYAGYVADEINFGTGKAPSNLLSFEPAWLSCKADCSNTQTVPYCYCGSACFGPDDPNCCYDSEGFCP